MTGIGVMIISYFESFAQRQKKIRKKSVEVKCLCQFDLAVGAQKFIQTLS